MADLDWKVIEITACNKRNDEVTWVHYSPTEGTGEANIKVEVDPANSIHDCGTAVMTISAATGEEKDITITRCLPECNCDAITYTAKTVDDVSENGGTNIPLGDGNFMYGCDSVEVVSNFDSRVDIDNEQFHVYANSIPESTNTVSKNEFYYYLTVDGVNCNKQGGFKQNKATETCLKDEIIGNRPSVVCPSSTVIPYNGGSANIGFENFNSCWNVEISYGSNGDAVKSNFIDEITYTGATVELNENKSKNQRVVEIYYTFSNVLDSSIKSSGGCELRQAKYTSNCNCDNYLTIKTTSNVGAEAKRNLVAYATDFCQDKSIPMGYTATSLSIISGSEYASIPDGTSWKNGDNFYAIFLENENEEERYVQFYLTYVVDINGTTCESGKTFSVSQSGTKPEPCKIEVSDDIIVVCDEKRHTPKVAFKARKSNGKCSTMNISYDFLKDGQSTGKGGGVSVERDEYTTYTVRPDLPLGNYTFTWKNTSDATNSGSYEIEIPDCSVQPDTKTIYVVWELILDGYNIKDDNPVLYGIEGVNVVNNYDNTNLWSNIQYYYNVPKIEPIVYTGKTGSTSEALISTCSSSNIPHFEVDSDVDIEDISFDYSGKITIMGLVGQLILEHERDGRFVCQGGGTSCGYYALAEQTKLIDEDSCADFDIWRLKTKINIMKYPSNTRGLDDDNNETDNEESR